MKSNDELQLEALLIFVRDHSGIIIVPPLIWRNLIGRLLPRDQDIQMEEHSLFDLLQTVILSLIYRFFETPTEEIKLRGSLITYLQYLNPVHRGSTVSKAFLAFNDPAVVEDISDLLEEHCRKYGRHPVVKKDIVDRLERLAATHKRTAERHVQQFQILLVNLLGEHLQDLFDLIPSAPVPDIQADAKSRIPDLSTLIEQYTISKCSLAPIAYGIRFPISECVGRLVHIQGERFAIESRHLPNHLVGYSGTIAGPPGSGRSTLLRLVALHGNRENINNSCFFYLSARDYLDFAKQGYTGCQYISWKLCEETHLEQEHYPSLVAKIEALDEERRLVFLVDDMEYLDDLSRGLVLSKLVLASSIFFSVNPRLADVIHDELARRNYNGTLVRLWLDGLDSSNREMLAKLTSHYGGTAYVEGLISDFFDAWNAEDGSTPIGIMAAIQTGIAEPAIRHLRFGYALFCEFLRRDGYAQVHLPKQADRLDPAIARIIRAGKLAREEILIREPDELSSASVAGRTTMSLELKKLQALWNDPGDDLIRLKIFARLRFMPALQVIFPSIEELLMTLDCFYYGGCSKCYWDILLPGSSGPIIRRVRQSVDLVPVLFDQ